MPAPDDDTARCPVCGAAWGDGYWTPVCDCPRPPRPPIDDDDLEFPL
jgi:hypothetical protein